MASSKNLGTGCLILFGLPFLLSGLFVLSQGVMSLAGAADMDQPWVGIALGLVFTMAGLGVMGLGIFGGKSAAKAEQTQLANPGEPWMWRADWAGGYSICASKSTAVFLLIFSAFWNLMSWPIALSIVPDELAKGNNAALVALLFPAIGLLIGGAAIYQLIAWRRFGRSVFQLEHVPIKLGQRVRGEVTFPGRLPSGKVMAHLRSIHRRVSGSGDDRTTHESILWEEEREVSPSAVSAGPDGTRIQLDLPVLPTDGRETDERDSDSAYLWTLQVRADVPGVDYDAVFQLPVFGVADEAETSTSGARESRPPLREYRPKNVTVGYSPSGGTELYFPPRALSAGLGLSFFTLIWTGFTVFIILFPDMLFVQIFFGGIFGLFNLLLIYASIQVLTGSSRLRFEGGHLDARVKILGLGGSKRYPYSSIASFGKSIGMQSGGSKGKAYYSLEMRMRDGKKHTLAQNIREKRDIEWVLAECRRLSGATEAPSSEEEIEI